MQLYVLTTQHNTLIHISNIKFYNCLKCTYENFIIYYSEYFLNFFVQLFEIWSTLSTVNFWQQQCIRTLCSKGQDRDGDTH